MSETRLIEVHGDRSVMQSLVGRTVLATTYEGEVITLTVEPLDQHRDCHRYLTGRTEDGGWMRLDDVVTLVGEAPEPVDVEDATLRVDRLWMHQDRGEVLCQDHAGFYLFHAIKASPRALVHATSMGSWVGVSASKSSDQDHRDFLEQVACESCGARLSQAISN